MNTRITIPVGDSGVKRKHFEGTPWNSLVAMSYINNKFRNNCVIIPYRNEPNDHTDLSIRWVQKKGEDGYLHVPKNFWTEFKKHLGHSHDKDFIVFPFGFSCAKSGGHANFILYDIKNKILERFDSLGKTRSKCLNVKTIDAKVLELFRNKLGYDFVKKYMPPFRQYKIFQELQDDENAKKLPTDPKYGFCSVWACWWVILRLLNPKVQRDKLIALALDDLLNRRESLTEFIRNFSQEIINHTPVVRQCLQIPEIPSRSTQSKSKRSKKLSRRKSKRTKRSRTNLKY